MNISCIYGLLVHLFNWMHKKYDQHPQLIDTVGHMHGEGMGRHCISYLIEIIKIHCIWIIIQRRYFDKLWWDISN